MTPFNEHNHPMLAGTNDLKYYKFLATTSLASVVGVRNGSPAANATLQLQSEPANILFILTFNYISVEILRFEQL